MQSLRSTTARIGSSLKFQFCQTICSGDRGMSSTSHIQNFELMKYFDNFTFKIILILIIIQLLARSKLSKLLMPFRDSFVHVSYCNRTASVSLYSEIFLQIRKEEYVMNTRQVTPFHAQARQGGPRMSFCCFK